MVQYLLVALIVFLAMIYLARKIYLTLKLKKQDNGCVKCHPAENSTKI